MNDTDNSDNDYGFTIVTYWDHAQGVYYSCARKEGEDSIHAIGYDIKHSEAAVREKLKAWWKRQQRMGS